MRSAKILGLKYTVMCLDLLKVSRILEFHCLKTKQIRVMTVSSRLLCL